MTDKDVRVVMERLQATEWSASIELCHDTFNEHQKCRLHIHIVISRHAGFRFTDASRMPALRLEQFNIKPAHLKGLVDPANGKRTKSTAPMHYYCQMPKKGKLASWTNHFAYKDFLVSPRWIVSFVQKGKMSYEDARKVSVFFCFNEVSPPYSCTENRLFSPILFFNISWQCLVRKMYSFLR